MPLYIVMFHNVILRSTEEDFKLFLHFRNFFNDYFKHSTAYSVLESLLESSVTLRTKHS